MNRPIKLENLHQLSVGSLIEQTHQLIGIGNFIEEKPKWENPQRALNLLP